MPRVFGQHRKMLKLLEPVTPLHADHQSAARNHRARERPATVHKVNKPKGLLKRNFVATVFSVTQSVNTAAYII